MRQLRAGQPRRPVACPRVRFPRQVPRRLKEGARNRKYSLQKRKAPTKKRKAAKKAQKEEVRKEEKPGKEEEIREGEKEAVMRLHVRRRHRVRVLRGPMTGSAPSRTHEA